MYNITIFSKLIVFLRFSFYQQISLYTISASKILQSLVNVTRAFLLLLSTFAMVEVLKSMRNALKLVVCKFPLCRWFLLCRGVPYSKALGYFLQVFYILQLAMLFCIPLSNTPLSFVLLYMLSTCHKYEPIYFINAII